MKVTILTLFISFFCFGCPFVYDPPEGILTIHNYSDSAMYVYKTCADSLQMEHGLKLFLDSQVEILDSKGNKKRAISSPNYRINAYNYGDLHVYGSLKNRKLPCGKQEYVNLFFIPESIMRTHTWQEIVVNQLFNKKMRITIQQLNSTNWVVTYVP